MVKASLSGLDMAQGLQDVLGEGRTMINVLGILFGFLLTVSVAYHPTSVVEQWLLLLALLCSVFSLSLFALPVIYHHVEFPYHDKEKFIRRAHYFYSIAFVPFGASLVLATALALWPTIGDRAIGVVAALVLLLAVVYWTRRHDGKK